MEIFYVELLTENAKAPTHAHENDAGLDLYASNGFFLESGELKKILIDVAFDLPPGNVGLILPRSSMNALGIHTFTGVIDAGYKGNVAVLLQNTGGPAQYFNRHDRIAQLLILDMKAPRVEVRKIQNESKRGINGFGSTGR